MKCKFCNSSTIAYTCPICGEAACNSHIETTNKYACKKHGFIELTHQKATEWNGKCKFISGSICPECSNHLSVNNESKPYFAECTSCNWTSKTSKKVITSSNETILLDRIKQAGWSKKSKSCGREIEVIEGKTICYNCIINYIKKQKQITDNELKRFGLRENQISQILKQLISENLLNGMRDEQKKTFIHIDPSAIKRIDESIKKTQMIDLEEIERETKLENEILVQIIISNIKTHGLRGTFTLSKNKYYLEKRLTSIILNELITNGRIIHNKFARKMEVSEGIIKHYVMNYILKTKAISAFFADSGKETITTQQIDDEILQYCKSKGKFQLQSLANRLKITKELTRKSIFTLIQSGTLRGIFTQNHEFITEEELSELIKQTARAYRKMPISKLAKKFAITDRRVEETLETLISKGSIAGYIDMDQQVFIANAEQPITRFQKHSPSAGTGNTKDGFPSPFSSSAGQATKEKSESEIKGQVEVVRQYDFVGGQLHFKVVVRNITNLAIHDIKIILDIPSSYRRTEDMKKIAVIDPGNTHGIDFYLEPAECGISSLGGTVIYKDATGKMHTMYIEKKDVQIKCPLVIKSLDTMEDCKKAIASLPSDARSFSIGGLDPKLAYSAVHRAITHFDTRNVESTESKSKSYEGEAWFSSTAKVGGGRIIIRGYVSEENSSLEVRVWCNNAGQLTGFLAKIIEILQKEMAMVRQIKSAERSKTLDAMTVSRSIVEVSDYCMLKYKASSIRLKMEDMHLRLQRLTPNKTDLLKQLEDWNNNLDEKYPNDEDMIDDEDADAIDEFMQVIHRTLINKLSI